MSAIEPSLSRRSTALRRVRRERKLVRFLVICDSVSLTFAMALALPLGGSNVQSWHTLFWAFLTIVIALVVFSFYRLYERDWQQISVSSADEIGDFANALSLIGFAELSLGEAVPAGGLNGMSRITILLFWLLAIATLALARTAFRHLVVPALNNPQNTVIVGAGAVGQRIAQKIRRHPEHNIRLVGFLDDEPQPLDPLLDDLPILGGEDDLVSTIRRHGITRVILAFSRRSSEEILEVVRSAGLKDLHLSIVPRYFEIVATSVGVGDVEGIPVLEVPAGGLSRLARFTKRSMDLALTIFGVVLLAPVLVGIAVAIKLDSPGPVFFPQLRMGRNQDVFRIFKFRTMVDGAEQLRSSFLDENESTGPLFKIREDPRVTRVGRWLRALSLDELPQLFNVFKGEMSLVGPRPFVVYEDELIGGWARERLDLTPGMTGLWQVLGRNEIDFDEMVRLDYLYVNNWSLWWDAKLLIRTIPIVLGRRGY